MVAKATTLDNYASQWARIRRWQYITFAAWLAWFAAVVVIVAEGWLIKNTPLGLGLSLVTLMLGVLAIYFLRLPCPRCGMAFYSNWTGDGCFYCGLKTDAADDGRWEGFTEEEWPKGTDIPAGVKKFELADMLVGGIVSFTMLATGLWPLMSDAPFPMPGLRYAAEHPNYSWPLFFCSFAVTIYMVKNQPDRRISRLLSYGLGITGALITVFINGNGMLIFFLGSACARSIARPVKRRLIRTTSRAVERVSAK